MVKASVQQPKLLALALSHLQILSIFARPEVETMGRTNTDSEGKHRRASYDVLD